MEMQVEIRFKKCGISNQPDVCICDDPCLSKFGALRGCMSASRRQWADFLVSLMAPLHRQYKTARTETRRHLLLKIRQMPTQTSASRGYVLVDIKMAFMPSVVWCRKGHTRILKLSAGCGHDPRSAPNLERHGSSKMQTFGWLEMPHFLIRISSYIPSEIEKHDFLSYYFSQQKGQPVSCGSPFFFINSLNRLHALRRLKAKQIDAGLKHRLRQL